MVMGLSRIVDVCAKISKSCLTLLDALGKPKLKVALISYYYQKPTISGVGIHVQNIAKTLVKHDCDVHIFCHGDAEADYKENGAHVHVIGRILTQTPDNISKKRLEYDIFESEVIKEFIRENVRKRFDIIHTHGSLTKAAFIIKKVFKPKWVHTFHAIEKTRARELSKEEKEYEDLISWIENTTNYCDGAIFVSDDLLREGKKHYTLKSAQVIPNGVDAAHFSYQPITKKNVLFIGRFSKEKGIDLLPYFIDHVMRIKDATFTAACPINTSLDGELKRIRETLAKKETQYNERVTIINNPQDQDKLKQLYADCQVYIQPSKYESFGLCILEAMATGRPVVAFNVGGIPEVIDNKGFVVDTKQRFINKVKRLLEDNEECARIGKEANMRAQNFAWDVIAKRTIQYYKEILQ